MDQEITCGVMPIENADKAEGTSKFWAWIDENFEKIFLVSGLLLIILFITFQTSYRYIVGPENMTIC